MGAELISSFLILNKSMFEVGIKLLKLYHGYFLSLAQFVTIREVITDLTFHFHVKVRVLCCWHTIGRWPCNIIMILLHDSFLIKCLNEEKPSNLFLFGNIVLNQHNIFIGFNNMRPI